MNFGLKRVFSTAHSSAGKWLFQSAVVNMCVECSTLCLQSQQQDNRQTAELTSDYVPVYLI